MLENFFWCVYFVNYLLHSCKRCLTYFIFSVIGGRVLPESIPWIENTASSATLSCSSICTNLKVVGPSKRSILYLVCHRGSYLTLVLCLCHMEDVLTFPRLARRRSVASSFSDALFSKAATIYCIRWILTEWCQALTSSYTVVVRVHLGSVEGMEVEDGSEEPFTPFSFSFSTLTPFLGGNSFFPLLAFLFLFLSSFSTPSLLNMCCLSPCDVRLKFWFFWACLSVYGSQFELL